MKFNERKKERKKKEKSEEEKEKMQNSILECQFAFHFLMINSQVGKEKSFIRKRGK